MILQKAANNMRIVCIHTDCFASIKQKNTWSTLSGIPGIYAASKRALSYTGDNRAPRQHRLIHYLSSLRISLTFDTY